MAQRPRHEQNSESRERQGANPQWTFASNSYGRPDRQHARRGPETGQVTAQECEENVPRACHRVSFTRCVRTSGILGSRPDS